MASMAYLSALLRLIRERLQAKGVLTARDLEEIAVTARATAGGVTKAERVRAREQAKPARADAEAEAEGGHQEQVAATDATDDGAAREELSLERRLDLLRASVRARYGDDAVVMETYPDQVIVGVLAPARQESPDGAQPGDAPRLYRQAYRIDGTGAVEFGERVEVEERREYVPVQAHDMEQVVSTLCAIRLDDGHGLPEWQQVHKIGEWAEPHASGQRIRLTRAMGDTMIRNFHARVLRRDVPLDEMHLTDQGGHALGWFVDLRWGSEGQGLPGAPEPDGKGPILYGRVRYNRLGIQKLTDEEYKYLSPQYHLNYVDKETGIAYGPTLLAVAATNNPFLRIRSIQGEPAPAPVVLTDGLVGTRRRRRDGREGHRDGHELSEEAKAMTTVEMQPIEPMQPQVQVQVQARSGQPGEQSAPEVQLTEQIAALSEQNRRLAAEVARLREERHRERVERFISEQVGRGVPPAVTAIARAILLNCSPDAEAVIALSDAPDAPKVNLFEAVQELVRVIEGLHLGARTRQMDQPLPPGQAVLDEQIEAAKREVLRLAGVRVQD
jgi:cell division protein FtsB